MGLLSPLLHLPLPTVLLCSPNSELELKLKLRQRLNFWEASVMPSRMPGTGQKVQEKVPTNGPSRLHTMLVTLSRIWVTGWQMKITGQTLARPSPHQSIPLPTMSRVDHHTKKCAPLTSHNQENLFQITQKRATTTITKKLTQWTSTTNSKTLVFHLKLSTDSSETPPLKIIE